MDISEFEGYNSDQLRLRYIAEKLDSKEDDDDTTPDES